MTSRRWLKDEVDGDLYTSGSGTLVRAMLADGLVDEPHLFVYPLTRGSGPRLFPEEAAPDNLSLAACESYENGVVYLGGWPTDAGIRPPRQKAAIANVDIGARLRRVAGTSRRRRRRGSARRWPIRSVLVHGAGPEAAVG
jgi:RibD domain-containing protein